jgi:nucleotide-binding universal stress UspA family protein
MVDLQRIPCPIDFSLASKRALDHAVVLAGWYGSRITVLHVNSPSFLPQPPILFAEAPHPSVGEAERSVETQVFEWVAPIRSAGIPVDVAFEPSHSPAAGILRCAQELPADLIVLGTHGRGGFERFMLGSVAEKVLRRARWPVLTVPPPATHVTKLPFKQILCPVDFFEPSLLALRYAFSIAQESNAALTLLHAIEWPVEDEMVVDRALDFPEYRVRMEAEAARRLNASVPGDARLWCEPVIEVVWGKAYRAILNAAERRGADLIVMGVRGRHPLDLLLFGSTTNQTVRQAPCPVLTMGSKH